MESVDRELKQIIIINSDDAHLDLFGADYTRRAANSSVELVVS